MKSLFLISVLAATCAFGQYRRGVDVSGAEWGLGNIPGTYLRDYTFQSLPTFQYFSAKNLPLLRIAVLWERLQPVLQAPLDPTYLGYLKQDIQWAKANNEDVILDIHNFARYRGNVTNSADLSDLWVRLSNEFKYERTVYAYDLMNEPHDMGTASWRDISQAVVIAIRANQDDKLILVPGDSWSSANRWVSVNGTAGWIQDPANNLAYEAHNYFDHDESGTYTETYDVELAANPNLPTIGTTRALHFINWCHDNNVRGIIDEYGIPYNDPRWEPVLDDFLTTLDAAGMDGAYWAAGEWWAANNLLAIQTVAGLSQDRPQLATLQKHLGSGYLTALSSGSISVSRATAGSLVTVYGTGFTDQTTPLTYPYATSLGNVTIQVTDASGATAPATMLYVSPVQINLDLPAAMAPGRATIAVSHNGTQVASGTIQVAATGPALLASNGAGYGVAAALITRVKADGTQTWEPVIQVDASGNVVPLPIDFGASTDQLVLVLFGTGIRGTNFTVQVGGTNVPVQYAGPQGTYPGLDQVNAALPRSLAGSGPVNVVLTADGVAANTVSLTFK